MPVYLRWYVFVSIAALLSLIFFPGRTGQYYISQQMFVSFTMYTEALSLVSQLYHMHIGHQLDGLNSYYLAALGVSRLTRIGFWISMSSRLSTFWFLIAADSIHTMLVIGFGLMYYTIRRETKGESVLSFSAKKAETELSSAERRNEANLRQRVQQGYD